MAGMYLSETHQAHDLLCGNLLALLRHLIHPNAAPRQYVTRVRLPGMGPLEDSGVYVFKHTIPCPGPHGQPAWLTHLRRVETGEVLSFPPDYWGITPAQFQEWIGTANVAMLDDIHLGRSTARTLEEWAGVIPGKTRLSPRVPGSMLQEKPAQQQQKAEVDMLPITIDRGEMIELKPSAGAPGEKGKLRYLYVCAHCDELVRTANKAIERCTKCTRQHPVTRRRFS